MTKQELAIENHNKKYNCCQAVICAFQEELSIPEEILFKIGEGFGLGMGGTKCTCGALTAAIMAAGLKNSDGNLSAPATKANTYQLSKEIVERFQEKAGSTICRELKGIDTGKVLHSCPDCIKDGVTILEEVLFVL